ncbi:putative transmembrane protein YxlG [Paenibacillus baekrokdamisoli]|uniref:Putative transmembrane protein YxlG n=1 Tax=Paenibacillus baekrokdamisoli TaxID=1712516 RepID=A0A3G9JFJ9_9BACL|nr:ABC transporter permease subunit [Paenibacillus baekrokdamisoli]MBB3071283.1 ABC-2 type transport system permease protein [Paenibacillus baekrokdamisoli]BBH24681.1 putative transmembrane protein YxlG [Paenibacillus baekrokdamisoli]
MSKWIVLYKKEWMELARSYKLIWVPLVFILLGAMQPVTTYFLPDILANAGNLPKGAVIEIPTPHPEEVLAQTIQQFGTLGLLVLALSFMGALSGERMSGTASMILMKPVSYLSFVTSKWAAMLTLSTLSFAAGFGAAWYYTSTLFDALAWRSVIHSFMFFGLWLVFVGTLTLLFSSLYRSAAGAAFSALATAALLTITASLFPHLLAWNPGKLSQFASEQLIDHIAVRTWPVIVMTVILITVLLMCTAWSLRKRPSLDSM